MTPAVLTCCALAIVALPGSTTRYRLLQWGYDPHTPRRFGRPPTAMWIGFGIVCMHVVCGPTAASAGAILAVTLLRRRRNRTAIVHRRAELVSLAEGLDIIIAEVRVGAHPAAACVVAAGQCGGSAAGAFRSAAARARLGGQAADGVRDDSAVIAVELARLSAAWRVSDEYGLPLADLLWAAREDLLGRKRFAERTESTLAGARATGTVLAILPLLGIALGEMMGAHPIATLLGGGLGGYLLVIGTALGCAGLVWTDAITQRVTS